MIGFLLGLLVANAGEWLIHKHLLHRYARRPGSWWAFHLEEHHYAASVHEGRDPAYERLTWQWNAQTKEAVALLFGALLEVPLYFVAPSFTLGLWVSMVGYYVVHRKAHLDPAWARKYLPWHYDHHMGRNPERNWCVTLPLWDHVMGTRVPGSNLTPSGAKTAV